MVLPVIAAGAARAAGTAAARGAVSTTARAGAQTAGRAAVRTTQRVSQESGRNIVRARRNAPNTSTEQRNITRAGGSARSETNESIRRSDLYSEQDEEYSNDPVSHTESSAPVRYRIGWVVALILLGVAGTLDAVELLLDLAGTLLAGVGVVLGYIKDIIAFVFFPAVFTLLSAPFWKGRKAKKKIVTMITGYLVEAIPWIGAFMPATLISVAVTIYITRQEDKGNTDVEGAVNKNITRVRRLTGRR